MEQRKSVELAVAAYVAWREECKSVRAAYLTWRRARAAEAPRQHPGLERAWFVVAHGRFTKRGPGRYRLASPALTD